jgi:8-oxo-dGTP diphosphatase
MLDTTKHSVSVAAAVVAENRVLAIRRRDDGHWEPPGGILELGETIEEGLRREVREETGLVVRIDRLTGVYKNMTRAIVALVFRCSAVGGALGETDEVTDFCWLQEEEIPQLMAEVYAVRMLDALREKLPAVRAHDGVTLLTREGSA